MFNLKELQAQFYVGMVKQQSIITFLSINCQGEYLEKARKNTGCTSFF